MRATLVVSYYCPNTLIYNLFDMAVTIDQIKKLLVTGAITPSAKDIVEEGVLQALDGRSVKYQLHHGWDIAKAFACDRRWGEFNLELLRFIQQKQYDAETLREVLEHIQMDDSHWRWFDKARVFSTSEYDWFFLMADNIPQGACLIYHPKPSVYDAGDIFYVEYIAAAPWNRDNPMSRVFKGVASIILKYAVNYAHHQLKLRFGFSLQAIPRATGFYQKIGMTAHAKYDDGVMTYFEMPEDAALKFAGV